MNVSSRPANIDDVDELVALYRALEEEQTALRPMWRLADGLAEPVDTTFKAILDDDGSRLVVGMIDDVPLGFAWARLEELLPQGEGELVAVIRLIHTDADARGVGIGETMIGAILEHYRASGVTKFDAQVSPGHRDAKNFFEANGFKARLIVMHRDDES